jgi:uncharacterized protein (TIGR02611 family)
VTSAGKRLLIQAAGWVVLVVGIAAIPLPGPGWMLLYAGVKILSTQYEWADRWLEPVELRALRGAAEAVETMPRVVLSGIFAAGVGLFGVLWVVEPDVPSWWPVADKWWLFGGPWTGVTLLISCLLATALLVYSFRRFHGRPEAVAELRKAIDEADEDVHEQIEHLRHRRDDEE